MLIATKYFSEQCLRNLFLNAACNKLTRKIFNLNRKLLQTPQEAFNYIVYNILCNLSSIIFTIILIKRSCFLLWTQSCELKKGDYELKVVRWFMCFRTPVTFFLYIDTKNCKRQEITDWLRTMSGDVTEFALGQQSFDDVKSVAHCTLCSNYYQQNLKMLICVVFT